MADDRKDKHTHKTEDVHEHDLVVKDSTQEEPETDKEKRRVGDAPKMDRSSDEPTSIELKQAMDEAESEAIEPPTSDVEIKL
jgi:hypothetical protein